MYRIRILKRAKELLTPETWLQGSLAKCTYGFDLDINQLKAGAQACKFCLGGAIDIAAMEFLPGLRVPVGGGTNSDKDWMWNFADELNTFCKETRGDLLGRWNDIPGRTLEEIHAFIDEVICKTETPS